ncbi:aldose epimerase [Pseudonocardiaceae bacterium YIM PH 21723]|nr:aldose epimerase [Pseudonocardiaceae bacterium YIM PH 21723]
MTLATGRQYEITAQGQAAVITEVGATLRSWTVSGQERLLTHGADEMGDSQMGKVLAPWPNRIDHGRYEFQGTAYQLPLAEPAKLNAIHGLVNWVPWQPREQHADRVTMGYVLYPQKGYPFTLDLALEYALTGDGLHVTLTARNVGRLSAPFGAGYHPYLLLDESALLTVPADSYLRTDDRLIPVGKAPVAGTPFDFRTPRAVDGTELDTGYTDLHRADGVATAQLDQVQLWVDDTHGYLQVYTDNAAPPSRTRRSGIALEPMTAAPNAFNSGDGLLTLEPGRAYQGSWGLRTTT